MSQIFDESWERTKWYLLQSLFTENPILSPIPEIEERTIQTPTQTEATISRPDSPLPDLIIEKEPNRHDEPEEFYKALERKVIKFYKKLFRNAEKSDQPSNQDYCNSKHNEEATSTLLGRIFSKEEEQAERSNEILKKIISTESISEVSTSSESQANEIIVTKALVHRGDSEQIDNLSVSAIKSNSSVTQKSKAISRVVTSSVDDTGDDSDQFEFLHLKTEFEDSSTSNNNHENLSISDYGELLMKSCDLINTSSPQKQPDIMRKRHTRNDSMESVLALNVGRDISPDDSIDKNFEMTSVRELEISEMSSPESSIILQTAATSIIVSNESKVRDGKRQISSESSSYESTSPKLTKFDNSTIQPCISSSESREKKWQKIRNNFFEGNPLIFKLCSCNNHECI